MGVEDLAQQERLRKARQARLNVLEEQAARMGIDTPPHITIEIGTLRKELEIRETVIASPIEAKLSQDLGPDGRFIYTAAALEQIGKRLDNALQFFSEWIERVEVRSEERTQDIDQRREAGQRANRNLILLFGAGLLVFMAIVVVVLVVVVRDVSIIRDTIR